MDRAGVIPLDPDTLPHEGITALLPGSNDRQVEKQLESLISRGWLLHNRDEHCLVDPDFIDREEAAMSNAQRLRESRARRRDRVMTHNASTSASRMTQNESQPTRSDTQRLTATHSDTPSVPSVPSVPIREESLEHPGGNGSPTVDEVFEGVWAEVQNKKGKQVALRKWRGLGSRRPAASVVIAYLKAGKKSEEWTKEGGKYCPHGSTIFSQERWTDGPESFGPPPPPKGFDPDTMELPPFYE